LQEQQPANRPTDQADANHLSVVDAMGDEAHNDPPDGEARPVQADPEARLLDAACRQQRRGELACPIDHAAE